MGKIDCSNIYNFKEEWERRRKNVSTVRFVPFEDIWDNKYNLKEMVDLLQKWSDEYPRKTRYDKFQELLKGTEFEDEFYQGLYCSNVAAVISVHGRDYWEEYIEEYEIDADKLMDFFRMNDTGLLSRWEIIEIIKKQPTAYDVGKVVEELKNEVAFTGYPICGEFDAGLCDGLYKAIDIVKKGGV